MRRHCIIYSETARVDIIAIGDKIREAAGELIAERFVARILATVESLEFMPARHRIRSELSADLRVAGFRKYLIFYRVVGDGCCMAHATSQPNCFLPSTRQSAHFDDSFPEGGCRFVDFPRALRIIAAVQTRSAEETGSICEN